MPACLECIAMRTHIDTLTDKKLTMSHTEACNITLRSNSRTTEEQNEVKNVAACMGLITTMDHNQPTISLTSKKGYLAN